MARRGHVLPALRTDDPRRAFRSAGAFQCAGQLSRFHLSADWDRALLSEKQLADILANHGYTLKAPRSPLRDALGFAGGVATLILLFFAVDRSPLGTWIAAFPTAKAA